MFFVICVICVSVLFGFVLHVVFFPVPHVLYREASGLFDRALWLAIGGYAFRALREEVGIYLDYIVLSCWLFSIDFLHFHSLFFFTVYRQI